MVDRILIADDHGVLRAGLRALLNEEPGFEVVGEAGTGDEALREAERLQPDVVLLDLSMPGPMGIEVAGELRRRYPQMAILILTVHEDESLVQEALYVGASGYIVKRAVESELINAIHSVLRGDLYVHPAMTRALLRDNLTRNTPDRGADVKSLTRREIEVLRLIAQGHTNREIGQRLHLSTRTVESHRSNIMSKLAITSRVELVQYAMEHGLLEEKR